MDSPRGLVLVVDDSRGMRDTLSELLRPFWRVEVAGDAETALGVAQRHRPDLVLVDLMLPGIDGIEFMRALKVDPAMAEVAVVILSGRAGSDEVVAGLEAGADDFLQKPFTPAELIARVRTHMTVAQARVELSERAALLHAQIQSAPMGVLAVSPQRRILAVNRRFEELWSMPPGSLEVGGESPALGAHTLSQVVDSNAFEAAIRFGHDHPDQTQELEVPLHDGRVIQGVSSPIIGEDGAYRGRIWFLTDDTERRTAEKLREELLERLQEAQRSQAFLLSAAQVLARATGYEETLHNLAAVAVPTLGDICLIDVVDEEQGLRRVAGHHVDPERQALVDKLGELYAPDREGPHPAAEVFRTGRSTWSDEMSEEFLRRTCRDEEHFRIVKELGFTSFMTIPLADRGEILGAITLLSAGSSRRLGPEDLALAEALAGQVAAVVGKARRYEQEHLASHTLQSSLLPSALPRIPGLAVAVRYLPGSRGAEVGGDWYDVVVHPSGATVLAVGDVAGHDIGAAAAMGVVRAGLRALVRHAEDPAALLELLQFSWDDLGVDRIATLIVAFVDVKTGAFSVGSAGHPPPLVVGSGHRVEFLPVVPATPLGGPPLPVEIFHGRLDPGDLILLYTDGVIESRQSTLVEGMEQLAELAREAPTEPERFCSQLLAHLGGVSTDDLVLLAAARR